MASGWAAAVGMSKSRRSLRRLRLVKDAKFEDTCIRTGAHPANPGYKVSIAPGQLRRCPAFKIGRGFAVFGALYATTSLGHT